MTPPNLEYYSLESRVALMTFWSWVKVRSCALPHCGVPVDSFQGFEDTFDAVNRKDLHNLIVQEFNATKSGFDISKNEPQDGSSECIEEDNIKELNIDNTLPSSDPALYLARLPTCAVFHGLTSGRGIPHSFAGTFQQDSGFRRSLH